MPKRRTDSVYVRMIAAWLQEGLKAGVIARRIEAWADENDRQDFPTERTVYRIADQVAALPEAVRRSAGAFHWPAACELGLLPWEASRAALDYLRFCDQNGVGRPTVQETRWYWRLTLASPSVRPSDAHFWGRIFASAELARLCGESVDAAVDAIEWALAYEPWADGAYEAYRAAATRGAAPIPRSFSVYFGRGRAVRRLTGDDVDGAAFAGECTLNRDGWRSAASPNESREGMPNYFAGGPNAAAESAGHRSSKRLEGEDDGEAG